jgi:hypothetical protein
MRRHILDHAAGKDEQRVAESADFRKETKPLFGG